MSAHHTPGPLKASQGWDGDPERWVVLVDGPTRYHIATIENGQPGDTCETEGYTARLFAAAPDLLDALKELRNFYIETTGLPPVSANAAIAKAKGGQP